MKFDP